MSVASAGVQVQVWLLLQLPTQLRHPLEKSVDPDASDQSCERITCTMNLPVRLLETPSTSTLLLVQWPR